MDDKINGNDSAPNLASVSESKIDPAVVEDRISARYHERQMAGADKMSWPGVVAVLIVCATVIALCWIVNVPGS